jgi:hypothetical protein
MLQMGIRLALGGVLVVAVAAKLAAPATAREALAGFGFRTPAARQVGFWGLIAAESVLAVAIVAGVDGAGWVGAALMTLLALSMVGAILAGRSGEPCGCFGARSRVGWSGVARNLLLAAGFAAVELIGPRDLSTDEWLGLGLIAALAAVAALAVAVFALAREIGLLRLRVGPASALDIPTEGPELGSRTEVVERIPGRDDAALAVGVFTSPGCHICASLGPAVDSVASHPTVALARFDEVADQDVWLALDIPGSPYAVAFDRDGTVLAKGTFNNLAQLESVLASAERRVDSMAGTPNGSG